MVANFPTHGALKKLIGGPKKILNCSPLCFTLHSKIDGEREQNFWINIFGHGISVCECESIFTLNLAMQD